MATFFKPGQTFAEQNQDPIIGANGLLASGYYRDIPGNIVQDYVSGRASQEDTIARIKGTPAYDPSQGPIINGVPTGPGGVTPNPGSGTGFSAGGKSFSQAPLDMPGGKPKGTVLSSSGAPTPVSPAPAPPGSPASPITSDTAPQGSAAPGSTNTGVDPGASASVQAILDTSYSSASGGSIPTSSSDSLLTLFKSLMGGQGAPPPPPNEADTFKNLNTVQGVDQAQNDYNTAKANLRNLENDIVNRQNEIKSQGGPQITSTVVNGQLTFLDSKTAAAHAQAQQAVQDAADTLNMKQATVAQIMQYTNQDYQNSSTYYNDNFKRNMDMLNAFEGILSTEQSQKSQIQKTAAANINIIQGLIADKSEAFKNPTQDQKTLWNQLELQAGLPLGTIQGYATARPGVKTITTKENRNSDGTLNGTFSVIGIDAQGNIVSDHLIGGGGGGGGSTSSPSGSVLGATSSSASPLSLLPGSPRSMPWNLTDESAPNPKNANVIDSSTGKTPNDIWQSAIRYALQGGNLQQFVGGLSSKGQSTNAKNSISGKAAALAAAAGVDEATLQQEFKANSASITKQVDYMNSTERAVSNAEKGGQQILNAFKGEGINTNSATILNKTLNELSKNFTDSGNIRAYQAGLVEVGNEYAQVFARGGQRNEAADKRAQDITNGNITLGDLQKVLTELQAQGHIVIQGSIDQVRSIAGGGGTDAVSSFLSFVHGVPDQPLSPLSPGSSSNSGSTYQSASGKTYNLPF